MVGINRSIITLVALFGAAFGTGCNEPTPEALKQVKEAERDFRSHNVKSAEQKLNKFLSDYPKSADSAEAYYLRALCGAEQSNKVRAEADARACLNLAKDATLRANAHATIGTLMFEANRSKEAIEHYEAALKNLPEKPPVDLIRFRYATCLQREGRWKEAKDQFAIVIQKYPSSGLATMAKLQFDWPHAAYSIQCGAFRERSGASSLESKLKSSGHRAFTETRSRSGEVLYTVYVGSYPKYEQARDALGAVQRSSPGAIIVP